MSATEQPLSVLLDHLAVRLEEAQSVTGAHGVCSPLALWLLLALLAPHAAAEDLPALETLLGTGAKEADRRARALLAAPHPAVRTAFAAWRSASRPAPLFDAFTARLPGDVAVGTIPSQEIADAWARSRTGGLVPRFPISLRENVAVALASALACDVSWCQPFTVVPASDLAWPGLTAALRVPQAAGVAGLLESDGEIFGFHEARSADGIAVVSVIGPPDAPPSRVRNVARVIGARPAISSSLLDLFALPLGGGHCFELTERVAQMASATDRRSEYGATLPAWRARSEIDLVSAGLADAAISTIRRLCPAADGDPTAAQSAFAEYDETGFRAAAVTAFGVLASNACRPPERSVRIRRCELRFGRPYAVCAWASERERDSPWAEIPIFSAWVDEVVEPGGQAALPDRAIA